MVGVGSRRHLPLRFVCWSGWGSRPALGPTTRRCLRHWLLPRSQKNKGLWAQKLAVKVPGRRLAFVYRHRPVERDDRGGWFFNCRPLGARKSMHHPPSIAIPRPLAVVVYRRQPLLWDLQHGLAEPRTEHRAWKASICSCPGAHRTQSPKAVNEIRKLRQGVNSLTMGPVRIAPSMFKATP